MLPRPPRPTLFPYTTLFRSPFRSVAFQKDAQESIRKPHQFTDSPNLAMSQDMGHLDKICIMGLRPPTPWRRFPQDRKSTRLNSSHLGISYAVFCLKKKNLRLARLVVVNRPGAPPPELDELERVLGGARSRVDVVSTTGGAIASRAPSARIRGSQPI